MGNESVARLDAVCELKRQDFAGENETALAVEPVMKGAISFHL